MAAVNGHLRISVHDGLLSKTATDIYFQAVDTATVAQLRTEMAAIVSGFNAVTAGAIDSAELRLQVVTPSAHDPTGTKLNDAVGLSFPVPSTGRKYPFAIPAAASGTLSGGAPDMAEDGLLDTFADILEANMTTTGLTAGFYTNSGFQQLGGPAEGYLPDRKFARDLGRKGHKLGV
jgi:hypothetical protein